jgi:hypothetical protein
MCMVVCQEEPTIIGTEIYNLIYHVFPDFNDLSL